MINGVAALEGRMLILITNHPENLNPALVQPGRVDYQIEFKLANRNLVMQMFRNLFRDALPSINLDVQDNKAGRLNLRLSLQPIILKIRAGSRWPGPLLSTLLELSQLFANADVSRFWLAGESKNSSSFLASYNGSKLHFAGSIFGDGTTICNLVILPLSQKHHDISVLNDNQTCLSQDSL
jgi:hypothetical protein